MPTSRHERTLRQSGYRAIAGVDEVGRGALFGPVFAAAVILDPQRPIRGLDDSKKLTPERRQVLAQRIQERALASAVGAADAFEIDHVNILEASRLAMQRAVSRLSVACDYLLVDAIRINLEIPQRGLIRGDSRCFSIAAASILAKVARDQAMVQWDKVFPGYGLASNKGYSAPEHLAGLQQLGPSSLHRFSFAPVRACREGSWSGYPVLLTETPKPSHAREQAVTEHLPETFATTQGALFACP
jgi:ribonuclease HII